MNSSASRGDCGVDHIWDMTMQASIMQGRMADLLEPHHPCFTCHTTKTEFSHDHGQHVDNSYYLLHKVSLLFRSPDLSDIQIMVGHKEFLAHKLILSSSSDVFRVMLTNPSWPESRRHKIVLKEEAECVGVFEDFLQYMYTGSIHLTHYTVLPVLMLADKYNVVDLRAVCVEYMGEHLVSTVEHNHAVSWMQYAFTCGHTKLAAACYRFALWNFHKIIATNDFLSIDKDLILDLVTRSDLVIPDEFTLFRGISSWLQHQQKFLSANDFYNVSLALLSHVRFPMITPTQLSQLDKEPLSGELSDFFLEKIVFAMNYHATAMEEQPDLVGSSSVSEQYTPRHYTNDMWSTQLYIDNYSDLPQHDVRPLFFSSPISGALIDENRSWEWNVDLFPKGIQFQRCIMIGLWRNLEISGAVYNSIRLVLSTKVAEVRNVQVVILVKGVQDNVEHVKWVVERHCMFDSETRQCHINDILPYDELNCPHSDYLTGNNSNSFKITIIVKPVYRM